MKVPVKYISKIPLTCDMEPKQNLNYTEFLQTTKVIRMLYGTESAKKYFTDNLELYYNKVNS